MPSNNVVNGQHYTAVAREQLCGEVSVAMREHPVMGEMLYNED
jgi:hypothetical protein